MIGRLAVLCFVAGVSLTHRLADLPGLMLPLVAALPGVGVWAWLRRSGGREGRPGRGGAASRWMAAAAAVWVAACGGVGWTTWQAQWRLDDALAEGNVNQVTRVELRVTSLPRLDPDRRQFEAEVLSAHPPGVPRRVLVNWPAPGWRGPYAPASEPATPFPEIAPGQTWRMALVTRPLRAALNPHAFDYEGHAFAQGLRATGTVRGTPQRLDDGWWASLALVAQRARHAVRAAMQTHLDGLRYGPVLLALAIGDQDGVDDADWRVFSRTGIIHLVSISGSHITMIAAFGGVAVYWAWRRLRWRGKLLAEYVPARVAAAWAALLVAWLYCLLAGWGVPARRTFMMLAFAAAAHGLRLSLGGSRILALAALAIVALDPWAVLSSGFWLSFAAVAVLLAVAAHHEVPSVLPGGAAAPGSPQAGAGPSAASPRWLRVHAMLSLAVRTQLAITLALIPPLAGMFHEVSVVSPLANAYAIPVIGWVVTPLSLLSAACAVMPGAQWLAGLLAQGAHGVLQAMMAPTVWLGALPAAHWAVAAAPAIVVALACAGVAWALWPAGPAWRRLGWSAMLPLLWWSPPRPAPGDWVLHALDVGQGSAVVLQTATRTLVYDTGARRSARVDEGARTLLPFLRAQGVRRLDVLVVSHGDLDHAGGLRSLLEGLPVEQSYSSFALQPWLRREARKLGLSEPPLPLAAVPCQHGQSWRVDGVSFEFLWPLVDEPGASRRRDAAANDASCVLRVRGAHHSVLLTGDLEARSEARLLHRGLGPADVVVAGHHGSATSSTPAWVERLQAAHVLIQAGSWNRYGHPAPAVVARWQRSGAQLWRTDLQGAILAESRAGALSLTSSLESSRRYWHGRRLQ